MYPPVTQLETRTTLIGEERRSREERTAPARTGPPPRYKLALLTWGGAYAVITVILALVGPEMASWPLALRTLILSVLMVVTLTWLVMPALTRAFSTWLDRSAR